MGFFSLSGRSAAVETATLSLAMLVVGCAPAAKSFPSTAFAIQTEPDIQRVDSAGEKVDRAGNQPVNSRSELSVERPQSVAAENETAPTKTYTLQEDQPIMTATQSQPARHGKVEHVNTTSFQGSVLDSDVPVLVDFYADWCGPCRMLAPALDKLARETPDARVVKVDIDKSPQLAARYRVSSIPTVMVFKDGSVVARHTGLADQKKLRQLLGSM
jgi:thioredoxin